MDRILGVNTIDLGGGRRGFRGKDTVGGIPGTELAATWHNGVQEELVRLIELCGGDPSNADFTQVAKAIQSGALNFALATGTANAWVIDLPLAPLAYAAGRVLNIIAPATNTSTTVNANISTLGNRRIKKADGTDPAVGDLVSGRVYATIDDGTSIRVLTTLPSDTRTTVAQTIPVGGDWTWSQSLTNGTQSAIGGGSYTAEGAPSLGDATFSGGSLTVGPATAGLWLSVFTAISPSAGTDLFTSIIFGGSTAIGYSTSQTTTSAPGISAVAVRRLANTETLFNRVRQFSGGTATVTGRLSLIRLGA